MGIKVIICNNKDILICCHPMQSNSVRRDHYGHKIVTNCPTCVHFIII